MLVVNDINKQLIKYTFSIQAKITEGNQRSATGIRSAPCRKCHTQKE